MKRSLLFGASAALLAVAVAGVWLETRSAPARASELQGRADASSTAAPTGPCQFEVGKGSAWSFSHSTRLLRAGASESATPAPVSRHDFTARLQLEPLTARVLVGRFVGVDEATLATNGRDLERPFLVRVSEGCEVVGFARSKATPIGAARAQQSLMHLLWFRAPTGEQQLAVGEDGIGRFEAVLATGEVDGRRTVQRRLTAYSHTWASTGLPHVEESLLTAQLGEAPWFESIRADEHYSGLATGAVRTALALDRQAPDEAALAQVSRDEASYVWENLLPRAASSPLPGPRAFSESERRAHAELKGVTLDQALDRFAARLASNDNVNEQWPLMARYLEANPESIPAYAQALTDGEFPSSVRGTAFLALGKARVPEARDALMGISRDETVLALDRHRANLAVVEREDVGVELAKMLRAEALKTSFRNEAERFHSRGSALMLGMMVGVRPRALDVQEEARAAIGELLARSTTASELRPAFGAIANTGDPAYLGELEAYSKNPSPEVRAAAARGFRRMRPEQSEAFVVGWLSRETSPDVKRELFHVIHHQHLDAQQNVSEAIAKLAAEHLRQQPLVLTRQSLVRILGPLAATMPSAKAALLDQVKYELHADSGLFDLLTRYLRGDDVSRALDELPEFQTEVSPLSAPASLRPTVVTAAPAPQLTWVAVPASAAPANVTPAPNVAAPPQTGVTP